jgi:hypothetical protein
MNINYKIKKTFNSFYDEALITFIISSYDVGLVDLKVRSTTDTLITGTLNAIPVSFPYLLKLFLLNYYYLLLMK